VSDLTTDRPPVDQLADEERERERERASRVRPVAPPSSGGEPGSGRASSASPSARLDPLERKLLKFFGSIALTVSIADPHCGGILATRAPQLAQSYSNLAKESASIRRLLEMSLEIGAWGQAISVTALTAFPILAHHDMLPPLPPILASLFHSETSSGVEEEKAAGVRSGPDRPPSAFPETAVEASGI
jgi:hypothetical protein